MSAYKEKKATLGFASLREALSGELRRGPAGRLMQRVVKDHPEASTQEVMQLFRDAAVDDQVVFQDVVALALRREPLKPQDPPKPREVPRRPVLTLVTRQRSS